MVLAIHIAAGGLAIILGAVALLAKKGGRIHRRIGLLFVYAMFVMAISAAIVAFGNKAHALGNVLAAFTTIYYVGTALTTVRPPSPWTRRLNGVALIVAVGVALADIALGVKAFNSPRGLLNGVPFAMHFFMAAMLLTAATGDLRIMRHGLLRGGPRIARHLWRMCFALFIAAGSFFSIRARVARVLPEPFTTAPMRALPIILVFVAMFYWLWRVRARRPLSLTVRHEPVALANPAD
jgi:hypothetical protein